MARVRLFANLREAAGTGDVEVGGATVAEILDQMSRMYGEEFREGLGHARVWVNGETAAPSTQIGEEDELALIPPVSGGASVVRSGAGLQAGLVALLVALVVVANLRGIELLAGALVALGGLWVWDLVSEAWRSGIYLERWPILLCAVVGAIIPYRMGMTGLGVAAGVTVMLVLVWGVARFGVHALTGLTGTFTGSLVVAMGIGSLVVTRLGSQGQDRINAFLLMVIAAGMVGSVVARYPLPLVDPLTGSALAVVAFGLIAGSLFDMSVVTMLLVGVTVALALIAGKALGSLLRFGEVYLTETIPGTLAPLDGPVVAAMVLAPILDLLT